MPQVVQKVPVPVRVSQPNQDPRDGWFLLFPKAVDGESPECIVELMNSPRVVLPFVQNDGKTILLLTRQNIDWVAVNSSVPEELVLRPGRTVTHSQRVELRFVDETRVEGVVQWDASHRNLRLSDFLNWCEDFFVLTTGFGMLVVNRQRIRETKVIESAARAAELDARGGDIQGEG